MTLANSAMLRAGAAACDITPKAGTHLGGTIGVLRDARVLAERLYARALVVESGSHKLCFVQPDLEIVTKKWLDRIRAAAKERCGLAEEAVMVHLPQTHSTPPLGNFILGDDLPNVPPKLEYLRGSQSEYCDFAVERIIESIVQANERLSPVQAGVGRAVRDDLAFNRRGITREGGIVMPWMFSGQSRPLGPTNIAYLEGPADPEIGVFCLRSDDLCMQAMLLYFTCHPVNVFATDTHMVSPDWHGAWCARMQETHGAGCTPLVLNGCCGNINPWPAFEPDFVPDHRRMGRALAETSDKIIAGLEFKAAAKIDTRRRIISLPLRTPAPADLAEARKMLADHPLPLWNAGSNPSQVSNEWMDAAMLMSVEMERERRPEFPYEIQAFRIGDTAFVGLPGEPFVEGQLAIKVRSPFPYTFVAHNTAEYAGYIAPPHSYARGGHEIRSKPAQWSKLESGALEMIVEESVALLEELHTG